MGERVTRLKGRQVEFFAAALGGPVPYTAVAPLAGEIVAAEAV
jgi:hypothetical protein